MLYTTSSHASCLVCLWMPIPLFTHILALTYFKVSIPDFELVIGLSGHTRSPFPPKNKLKDRNDVATVRSLIRRSYFILPHQHAIWDSILEYYLSGQYFYFLVLVFPQLEQCTRRVFGIVNNLQERIMSAESDTLYTTLGTYWLCGGSSTSLWI